MTTRIASCSCGQLQVTATGEPYGVSMCHCTACQRRTGSPFGVGAYFKLAQLAVDGEFRNWERRGTSGGRLTNHFCGTCGSTVFWTTDFHPDGAGIGTGSFADPQFGTPLRSVWEAHRHDWVEPPAVDRFVEASSGPRVAD